MDVLFNVNEAYASKLLVAFASLIENNSEKFSELYVHIRTPDLSELSKEQIINKALEYSFPTDHVQFYDNANLDKELQNCALATFKNNLLTYYKIFGLTQINCHDDRLMIFDVDIMVKGNIGDLWNLELDDCVVGLVLSNRITWKSRNSSEKEYNTGIILIDMKKYKSLEIESVLLDYIQFMPPEWITGDQALISLALGLKNLIKVIPLKYNFVLHYSFFTADEFNRLYGTNSDSFYSETEFNDAKKNPVILHLIDRSFFSITPWYKQSKKSLRSEWSRYLKNTIWENYKYENCKKKYLFVNKVLVLLRMLLPSKIYISFIKRIGNV